MSWAFSAAWKKNANLCRRRKNPSALSEPQITKVFDVTPTKAGAQSMPLNWIPLRRHDGIAKIWPMSTISGLLVVDKPAGLTSFQCVDRIRKILGGIRVGHCGTLDPMAQGVLLVLYGAATKLQDQFLALEKQYWFRARWGIVTDTGDREGKETGRFEFAHVAEAALRETLTQFVGAQQQTPPMYAALKYKGKHYYDWASAKH